MGQDKRRARSETRRKTEYGRFTVESERGTSRTSSIVVDRDGNRFDAGIGKDGKKRAKALAAALEAADVLDMGGIIPDDKPSKFGSEGEWEEWAAESAAIPAEMFKDGKYSAAGYLCGVYRFDARKIARKLGVSEQSARQYLSDLRAGRRSD